MQLPFKSVIFSLVAVVLASYQAEAAQTTVAFDSGGSLLYTTVTKNTALTAGNLTTAGDGAIIQLGYYSTATISSPFSGTFVPLSGAGSANVPFRTTSVGDDNTVGAGTGNFALTLTFVLGNTNTGNNLPAAGTPLSIRFYNTTSLSTATAFNAASDSVDTNWRWQTPQDGTLAPSLAISFDDPNVIYQGGSNTSHYTSIAFSNAVPEPSTTLVVVFGLISLVCFAKRQGRKV